MAANDDATGCSVVILFGLIAGLSFYYAGKPNLDRIREYKKKELEKKELEKIHDREVSFLNSCIDYE